MKYWVSLAVLPALSVQIPVAGCDAPSPLVVSLADGLTTPERASEQPQFAVTSALYQTAVEGPVNVIVGGVPSRYTVTD